MEKHEIIPSIEGYKIVEKTISLKKANIVCIGLFVVFGALCCLVFFLLWGKGGMNFMGEEFLLFAGLLWVGIVLHELVHGITWLLLTHKGFHHLKFGLMKGAAYCHIDVPMIKHHYIIGALMPLFLVGIVPLVVAFCIGSLLWLLLGVIFVVSAIGDIMIVWAVRKEPSDALIYDHPTEGGCFVYHKISQ